MAIATFVDLLLAVSPSLWRSDAVVPAFGLLAGLAGAWLSASRPSERGSPEEIVLAAQVVM